MCYDPEKAKVPTRNEIQARGSTAIASNGVANLHVAWQAATREEKAEFMYVVGLVGELKGPVGPQEKHDDIRDNQSE